MHLLKKLRISPLKLVDLDTSQLVGGLIVDPPIGMSMFHRCVNVCLCLHFVEKLPAIGV